jgi:hypothetical protein
MPAGNLELKAKWKINQYTITFNTEGGSEVASITQDYGTAISTGSTNKRRLYICRLGARTANHDACWKS